MKKLHIPFIIGIGLLIASVVFNLWLYRLEPTATTDPNDNTFQFALVDRTNEIWDYANRVCSTNILTYPVCFVGYMVDHWVPNWAEGYSLPFFYTHIPQILIVFVYRIFGGISGLSLYQLYKVATYLLLALFPVPVFLALRVAGLGWLTAGIGAVMATQFSTDGLYGLDPPSFLWRGYGLSSQLFAMIWLPLSTAYGFRYFQRRQPQDGVPIFSAIGSEVKLYVSPLRSLVTRKPFTFTATQREQFCAFWGTVIFTVLTIGGHLGVGIMAMMSLGFLSMSKTITAFLFKQPIKEILRIFVDQMIALAFVAASSIFFMSYFIIPTLVYNNFHNISFWDPIWKFDSYGWIEVLNNLFNGDLFDFGRFPVITILVAIGIYAVVTLRESSIVSSFFSARRAETNEAGPGERPLIAFAYLFIFWLVFYFGRTTWGGLIDLIPGMSEVHLSRFIVGLHLAGFFLAPIGFVWIATMVTEHAEVLLLKLWKIKGARLPVDMRTAALSAVLILITALALPPVIAQTVEYNELNNELILQANRNHATVAADTQQLFDTLKSLPSGRVFAGRGGAWGKDFEVAETPYYMHLSTYGVPTVLWMPQTWSPNSDIEQYFSEGVTDHWDLYNIRYVAAPPDQETMDFWELKYETPTWKLYEVPTSGYFTAGTQTMTVAVEKTTFKNIVHIWTQSELSEKRQFPELTFQAWPRRELPVIDMFDEVTYQTPGDERYKNIFNEPPLIEAHEPQLTVIGPERIDADMSYTTTVTVPEGCTQCLLVLKQTAHPNWHVTVDQTDVDHMIVFPFFTGVRMDAFPGTRTVTFTYKPNALKMTLLIMAKIVGILLLVGYVRQRFSWKKK